MVLVVVIIFSFGNRKDFLMKILQPLLQVIASSIQNYFGVKTKVGFDGNCLKQDKITNNHGKVVNIYTVYEISRNINISDYPTRENCLCVAVSLTKNADINQ